MAKVKTGKADQAEDLRSALMASVPELMQTQDDSITIREWIIGLIPFFERARALEVAAKARLASARTLTVPANGDQDTAIQGFIRAASTENKVVEDHWKITSIVYQFQRRLVTARKRATDALEEAAGIAQRLHNTYTEAEQRRVDEINRQRQREADEKAQRERDEETARLEQLAIDAEAKSKDLSPAALVFVTHYIMWNDPVRAAQRAGYKDFGTMAARLLAMPKVQAAVKAQREAAALREQAAAKREEPVSPAEIVLEKADRGTGGIDRTTKTAEIFDARLFVEAAIGGRHGIPADCLMPDPVKLNDYARSMGEMINRWPGVKLKKKTGTV